MSVDVALIVAGLIVGFTVGLTGMGGGALMTPILVLFLGVTPSAAVASDLMASLVMKPVGASVHAKHGTIDKRLVGWLCLGSVPAAFAGVLILQAMGGGADFQDRIKVFLGIALLLAAATMILKSVMAARRGKPEVELDDRIRIRPVPTIIIGIVGGVVVGMTSVGSGSLIIVALLLLYPTLTASRLVGTDLVQAIPLVAAATLGHLLFGDFNLEVTTSLLIGAIPAVYFGARVSAKAPDAIVRPALVLVLLLSALKLLGAPNQILGLVIIGGGLGGLGALIATRIRRRNADATAQSLADVGAERGVPELLAVSSGA